MKREDRPAGIEAGRLQGIAGALVYVALFGLTYGISHPLLTVLLERQGLSGLFIGASAMVSAFGAVASAPFLPTLLRAVGLAQMLVIASAMSIVGFLLLALIPDPWIWFPLRFWVGVAVSIAFYGSEYWIVALAPDAARGRTMAFYTVSISITFGVGPLLLAWIGFDGWPPFLLVIGILALGVPPVLLVRRYAPHFTGGVRFSEVPRFILRYPVPCIAVVVFGVLEAGMLDLLPAWAIRSGLASSSAAILVAMIGFGSVFLQLLIGAAGDRMDTRPLMLGCALASAVIILALGPAIQTTWLLWLLTLAGGGVFTGLYTLALLELGRRFTGRELAIGNAAVILSYGLGAVVGPVYGGVMMDAIPPDGLLYALAFACFLFVGLLIVRKGLPSRRALTNLLFSYQIE